MGAVSVLTERESVQASSLSQDHLSVPAVQRMQSLKYNKTFCSRVQMDNSPELDVHVLRGVSLASTLSISSAN